jgi:hypothetical protein
MSLQAMIYFSIVLNAEFIVTKQSVLETNWHSSKLHLVSFFFLLY